MQILTYTCKSNYCGYLALIILFVSIGSCSKEELFVPDKNTTLYITNSFKGSIDVYIDGAQVGTLTECYSKTFNSNNHIKINLLPGKHTIVLRGNYITTLVYAMYFEVEKNYTLPFEINGISPNIYSGIPPEIRTIYHTERFITASKIWQYAATSSKIEIAYQEESALFTNPTNSRKHLLAEFLDFDTGNNYEYEVELQSDDKGIPSLHLLLGGANNSFLFYHAYSFVNSHFDINIGQSPVNWIMANTSIINYSTDLHKLTIRKFNNQYYFFLDEILVFEHAAETLSGSQVGLEIGAYETIKVDEIGIYYLSITH